MSEVAAAITTVRTIPLNDDKADEAVLVAQKTVGEEAVVWDAGLVLAHFIIKHWHGLLRPARRFVEIGAGTGAVGLTAAALGADHVTLTDLPRFVPLLEEAIALNNFSAAKVTALPLTWGSEEDAERVGQPADCILVSDCLFYEASVEPLVNTLQVPTVLCSCPTS